LSFKLRSLVEYQPHKAEHAVKNAPKTIEATVSSGTSTRIL
jgi:hypothetical protein